VLDPVPFADEPGAGDRIAGINDDRPVPGLTFDLVGQQIQRPARLAGKTAEGQFLDPVAEP